MKKTSPTLSQTSSVPLGRYAPSPSGDLHLGNLRTALLAWLLAHHDGGRLVMRVEDLDRVKAGAAEGQLGDLAKLGLTWDKPVLYQSSRLKAYRQVIDWLSKRGLTYECYCTRKEIQEAASAPHAAPGAYPGTCRLLSEQERAVRRQQRPAAIRLAAQLTEFTIEDRFAGTFTGEVDDFVLLRNDGTPAYNLAVVVDDHFQGVTQVVRGDDLLPSTPRQAYLASLLGYPLPQYAHVPLALNAEGKRLAKRDGAVTLAQLLDLGASMDKIMETISASLGLAPIGQGSDRHLPRTPEQMLSVFDPDHLTRHPWVVTADLLKGVS